MTEVIQQVADPAVIRASKKMVEVLALNSSRRQATFYNESPHTLFLFFKKTDKLGRWTTKIPPDGYYELPLLAGEIPTVFRGAIYGVWDGDAGSCRVTEFM